MRFIDVCHAIALAALLAWLFLGNLGDSARSSDSRAEERAAASAPSGSETTLQPQPLATAPSSAVARPQSLATAMSAPDPSETVLRPQPVATAQVDERRFWIFVAESPGTWSVAVSEDD